MSTYSPSLRIQLITTGDQAGTWGSTTNTNLGTLIEAGIAGYISVSVTTANQALTALDGAADESRNAVIALTTTTGAAFNVYAPPAEKTYVIYNASAYTATIYNSTVLGNTTAAGAGVAVPAGKTMTIWSDGTNFALQNTHLIGTVVGDVTGNLNGNLTAAAPTAPTATPGTSTTQIATTAFSAAAITAERSAIATLSNKTLASPTLTGVPEAPTAAVNNNTTQVATTAFVVAQIADDAPTKTGTGASGTWGISISGNAATATNATNATNANTVTTVTTNQILAALASASLGDIGTYAWLITVPDATITEGSTVAGSSLRYSGVYTDGSGNSGWPTGSAPSGTWRAMGTTLGGYGRTGTLFLRIS